MSKNILVTRKIPDVGVKMLEDAGFVVDVNPKAGLLEKSELLGLLKQKAYDGVICLLTDQIDAEVFDSAPSVKIFVNFASGFDNINLDEAKARGVVVANAPSTLTGEAVAEHTLALLFALVSRVVEGDKFIRDEKYHGWDPMLLLGTSLSKKTMGIVGGGRIGERVAELCHGLGLQIIYHDVNPNENLDKKYGAKYFKSLEEFLPQADFVSLHVPLLPSTKHLIDEAKLRLMKPTSFLINTARGPVVDELALEKILRERVIAGAGLDVFEFEPKVSPGLLELSNVVLTPHISSANMEVREDMAKLAATNILEFFNGQKPEDQVTK